MKLFLITIVFVFGLTPVFAQVQQNQVQTNAQLALAYYNAKEFEKAAPLLLEVYNISGNNYYFRLYVNSLLEIKEYDRALEKVQAEIQKQNNPNPGLYIHWGYILKVQNQVQEAQEKYRQAIENIPPNKGSYLITANDFMQWREYEWAEKTYMKGREVIPQESFYYEIARVNLYLRDYDQMMDEYLNLVRQDEKQLRRVESSLASAMSLDIDDGLRDQFRQQVLKRIQAEPEVTGYNRLLIWFFLQEKKFAGALRQSVALDRRTGDEDALIFQLAQMALNSKMYEDAQKAYAYLMDKGENNPYFRQAYAQNIHASYLTFTTTRQNSESIGPDLVSKFENGLEFLNYSPATLNLIQEFGHLLAFYLNEPEKAEAVLKKGLAVPKLNPEQTGLLKTELADTYVYANDPWEAMLLYSQVIDANKDNSLGDLAKLKKAKLGYYLGNFSWAKAQLDVLKASTSKLTANDAMELSMFVNNNLELDTTAVPLEMFSRADLLFFRHKDSLALATLDSITEIYPYHSLVDDILFRKSKIAISNQNYQQAAQYLDQIRTDFSYDLLADDAVFTLAEIYNYDLDEKEKAKEMYKEILTGFPGSVYTDESRAKYRELREIYPDETTLPENEQELFQEKETDEFK